MLPSRTVSVSIFCPARDACEFIRNPSNLPRWATGLGGSATYVNDDWHIETPAGPAILRFVPANDFGVVDHEVILTAGGTTRVPMRVLPNGEGCEVTVTLFQPDNMTEREFSRDVNWVKRDLEGLRTVLEDLGH